jgi:hypothetical protein
MIGINVQFKEDQDFKKYDKKTHPSNSTKNVLNAHKIIILGVVFKYSK